MTTSKNITKKDINNVFWRSMGLEWSWNYERQMNVGYAYSLIPIIDKMYDTKEEKAEALQRHLEFFNTTPHFATLVLGISAAMEENNALDKNFDTKSINNIKLSLMGPLAGVGDSFIWGTLRIVATGIGLSLATKGNILGPILFLLTFNIPAQGLRYYLTHKGYEFGADFMQKLQESGLMQSLTYGASILGLIVVGAMTAENVAFHIPVIISSGEDAVTISDICNNIMPGLLPLLFTLCIYYLLRKNIKTTTLLIICATIGLVGAFFEILG